ncbi:secondary thiamine-phosphate synthase enzyme YjbQ [Candidatus Xianfuyuplasma coldseepsis]|uniref:YjbQ family protein n=1 Tax=Candidatus Xianfuyuplasma coldseepsis TaxID=2782163 RepID=A0A7L7KPR1_9MOLU|nr:secondary thiamine-phosphate synthase enzyme YjbQ [Xianfuyuplasma coldseepsis]QMS84667.1 YjbQ family protein [Xianfuyuplasma coldseepsis]
MTTIQVRTNKKNQMINVTSDIRKLVRESAIQEGIVVLFVPHTTAAITINENADPTVKSDMLNGLETIIPNMKQFRHLEGNSDAHIKSSLVGVDQTILVHQNELVLGMWQGIYFCEFDGPRTRNLVVEIISN